MHYLENHLKIAGRIHSRPFYAVLSEGRVMRFTLKHQEHPDGTKNAPPFTLVNCEYWNPPADWWDRRRLTQGSLVCVEGPVSLLNFPRKDGTMDKTIKCTVEKLSLLLPANRDPPRRLDRGAGLPPASPH